MVTCVVGFLLWIYPFKKSWRILKWGCIFKTMTCNISYDYLNGWEWNGQNHSQPSNLPRITTFENFWTKGEMKE